MHISHITPDVLFCFIFHHCTSPNKRCFRVMKLQKIILILLFGIFGQEYSDEKLKK